PFGHAGEEALDAAMKDYGGFSHNDQTLRILTSLERRYAGFDGLNLTWETLEGTVKHNGPVKPPLSETIAGYNAQHDLDLATWPSAEAQVAALSDDIAYDNHDIDDGFRAGLFTLDDLRDVPLIGEALAEVRKSNRAIDDSRAIHEAVRRLIDRMVTDVVAETRRRIEQANIASADAVRQSRVPLVAFSAELREREKGLREFLFERMYRHYRVNRMSSKARRVVADLFGIFNREPELLPSEWRDEATKRDAKGRARVIADYIAGMTDRFALDEHRRLFEPDATT
ncbi:MAG: dGTP triphosphohydrolase, partial [Stellaceae bacterium]